MTFPTTFISRKKEMRSEASFRESQEKCQYPDLDSMKQKFVSTNLSWFVFLAIGEVCVIELLGSGRLKAFQQFQVVP